MIEFLLENVRNSYFLVRTILIFGTMFSAIVFSSTPASLAQATNSRSITGIIVDTNGSVIVGSNVSLKQDQHVVATTTTNSEGRFELLVNGLSRLSIEVNSAGFDVAEIPLTSTTTFPLRIVLTPHTVSAEVTISANRIATNLRETAASVVFLTNSALNTTGAATLDDALRQVAGFSLFRRSGSRTANPTSQGVSLRATGASGASRALVLADGIPLNDPFGGWVYWDRVPREAISQVEVLLGAASHLYGSSALGGVIDLTTKRADTNSVRLTGSYGNETTPNSSFFASGTKKEWAVTLAAETFHTNGYVLVPESQRGLIDTPAGTRDSVINLRLARNFGTSGQLFAGVSSFGESRENGTPLQLNRTHLRQFVFGGSWKSGGVGSFSARAYGGTQVYDQTFSAISADRNSETLTRLQRVPAQTFGIAAQWSKLIGRHQTIVAGFDGREVRGASDEIIYVNGRASSLVGAGGRERDDGIYAEDLIQVGSRFFVNLGGRIDRWRNYAALSASRPITAPIPTSVTFFPDRTENALSPHASGVYRLNDHVSLTASMSRAFRAPTLNELYRSFRVGNILTLANENLRAERLTGGEAGVRVRTADDLIELRGNFFWNEINRPVANVTLATTPSLITRQRQNLGRTRSSGVELQTNVKLSKTWLVSGSYLFADATVVRFPANTSLEGLLLPQVPRHQLTFQMQYENRSLVTLGVQGRASSFQFEDDQNQFQLAPYFTIDAFISRRIKQRLEVFAAVENLFNQRYEVGKTPVTTLGPPILARAGFRFQLGGK